VIERPLCGKCSTVSLWPVAATHQANLNGRSRGIATVGSVKLSGSGGSNRSYLDRRRFNSNNVRQVEYRFDILVVSPPIVASSGCPALWREIARRTTKRP
jgi:hypothetical protein